ncbi:MAG: hypothetical protein AAF558_11605 [Verrucomicrobiota bacterium]
MEVLQKIILLEGEPREVTFRGEDLKAITIKQCPSDVQIVSNPEKTNGVWRLVLKASKRRLSYQSIHFEISEGNRIYDVEIPTRIFCRNEFFLCVVTTSNFHWGYRPEKTTPVWAGDPLIYHGHGYRWSKYMAEGAHRFEIPMTWLIDGEVAKTGAPEITKWHYRYGDDVGVLPTSYFHHNAINYNTDRDISDAQKVLEATLESLAMAFSQEGFFFRPQVGGVDQWIGGVGSQWIEVIRCAGLRSVWGMCFDHETCDTSMYHEGCPWDAYRMRPSNFRYPTTDKQAIWGLPWTSRDLVNSLLEYPGASTSYSTDPDDIKYCGILDHQEDYWNRIIESQFQNRDACSANCFIVHNEDHDAHREFAQQYLINFYRSLNPDIVPSTLEEVTQWLDLKFDQDRHPYQLMQMEDPITCHDAVVDYRNRGERGGLTFTPPDTWKSVDGHNPSVACYYDESCRWAAREGERTPFQYINYTSDTHFEETGCSSKEELPAISEFSESIEKQGDEFVLRIEFIASVSFSQLPMIWWDRPLLDTELKTRGLRVELCDVTKGWNSRTLRMAQEQDASERVSKTAVV